MNPFMYQMYANVINDCIPKIKEQKPDSYYKNTPKSERKKVGTGYYRNGKEIMKNIEKEV